MGTSIKFQVPVLLENETVPNPTNRRSSNITCDFVDTYTQPAHAQNRRFTVISIASGSHPGFIEP